MESKAQILEVKLERDVLTISVGINTLGIAIEAAPFMTEGEIVFDEKTGNQLLPKVVNCQELAESVLEALKFEDEIGTTMVHKLFDQAAENALEDNFCGIEFPRPPK